MPSAMHIPVIWFFVLCFGFAPLYTSRVKATYVSLLYRVSSLLFRDGEDYSGRDLPRLGVAAKLAPLLYTAVAVVAQLLGFIYLTLQRRVMLSEDGSQPTRMSCWYRNLASTVIKFATDLDVNRSMRRGETWIGAKEKFALVSRLMCAWFKAAVFPLVHVLGPRTTLSVALCVCLPVFVAGVVRDFVSPMLFLLVKDGDEPPAAQGSPPPPPKGMMRACLELIADVGLPAFAAVAVAAVIDKVVIQQVRLPLISPWWFRLSKKWATTRLTAFAAVVAVVLHLVLPSPADGSSSGGYPWILGCVLFATTMARNYDIILR